MIMSFTTRGIRHEILKFLGRYTTKQEPEEQLGLGLLS